MTHGRKYSKQPVFYLYPPHGVVEQHIELSALYKQIPARTIEVPRRSIETVRLIDNVGTVRKGFSG